jgi:hypothetical protein
MGLISLTAVSAGPAGPARRMRVASPASRPPQPASSCARAPGEGSHPEARGTLAVQNGAERDSLVSSCFLRFALVVVFSRLSAVRRRLGVFTLRAGSASAIAGLATGAGGVVLPRRRIVWRRGATAACHRNRRAKNENEKPRNGSVHVVSHLSASWMALGQLEDALANPFGSAVLGDEVRILRPGFLAEGVSRNRALVRHHSGRAAQPTLPALLRQSCQP